MSKVKQINNKTNIEENKKILENLKDVLGTGLCKFGNKIDMNKDTGYVEAIENILADRERLEVKAKKYDSLTEKVKEGEIFITVVNFTRKILQDLELLEAEDEEGY